MLSPPDFDQVSDQLLATPFAGKHRVDRLHMAGEKAASLLLQGWEKHESCTPYALRLAMVYCGVASLQATATRKPPDLGIAKEVANNVQALSDHLLSTDITSLEHLRQRTDGNVVRGKLSEIAVFGVLWWGIANGQHKERSYVIPATKEKDTKRNINGYKRGLDLTLYQINEKKQKIQVKTSNPRKEIYYPGIAVVILSELFDRRQYGPFGILHALAQNQHRILAEANYRAKAVFAEAQCALRSHQLEKTKVALRQT